MNLELTQLQIEILKAKKYYGYESYGQLGKRVGCDKSHVMRTLKTYGDLIEIVDDSCFSEELYKLQKSKQKFMDQNRVERKKFRELVRYENAIESYGAELCDIMTARPVFHTIKHESLPTGGKAIIQLSDPHFNELISLPNNTFDFPTGAKRLKKFVMRSKQILKAYGVDEIFLASTGDLLNSDRRLDELLNQATNRAKATVLSALLIEQMIIDLNKDFNVNVAWISGNEGRKQQETGASDIVLSNNYDWMIMEMVKFMFRGAKGITFHDGPMGEQVINVGGWNVLMIHGNQIKSDNNMTTIQKIKGKYADKGISIQYVIFGHLHAAQICDIYSRSSSLCGANAYSETELQFSSRASQNLHIFQGNTLDVLKIDLQNVDGIEGYKIDEDLEAYNAKSVSKVPSMNIPTI